MRDTYIKHDVVYTTNKYSFLLAKSRLNINDIFLPSTKIEIALQTIKNSDSPEPKSVFADDKRPFTKRNYHSQNQSRSSKIRFSSPKINFH